MLPMYPNTATAVARAVGSASAQASITMTANKLYLFTSSTACYIKQGSAYLLTLTTKAGHGAADTFSITLNGKTKTFELDKAADGVADGNIAADISGATTAAEVAAIVAPIIAAAFPLLTVTDNTDGTIGIVANGGRMTMSESGAATVAAADLVAAAASGSMFVPANMPTLLHGMLGPKIAVIRSAADGTATIAEVQIP